MCEHDLSILHHAYYVGELEVGRRAAERLLSRSLPPDSERQARGNRTWYTQTLSELGPVEFRRIEVRPAHPGWSLFNPTLLLHEGRLVGLVRSSNFKLEGTKYIAPPEDKGVIRTASVWVEYSSDFRVLSERLLGDPDYVRNDFPTDGLEDCRLYAAGGRLCVSATVRNFRAMGNKCRIGTAEIDLDSFRFRGLDVPEMPGDGHEKNWMPVIGRDCWLYSCNSSGNTVLVRLEDGKWRLEDSAPAPVLSKEFRGGTQVVPFCGGYLCAIHEVVQGEKGRIYEHRFVWFDEGLEIRKVSPPFCFLEKRCIEFASGMAVVGGRVVLSFGHKDREAWLAVLDFQVVSGLLFSI